VKIFLGGEGPTELGEYFKEPSYRNQPGELGVLEALLRKIKVEGWEISGAERWSKIRKYKVGRSPEENEVQNVLGLVQMALDANCDAVVFTRDRDRYEAREEAVFTGIERAKQEKWIHAVVGGVAIEEIEAWILALLGEHRTERVGKAKEHLEARHRISNTSQMVEVIENADLDKIPSDAASLRRWLDDARAHLDE
jgi:hypothetical protein